MKKGYEVDAELAALRKRLMATLKPYARHESEARPATKAPAAAKPPGQATAKATAKPVAAPVPKARVPAVPEDDQEDAGEEQAQSEHKAKR